MLDNFADDNMHIDFIIRNRYGSIGTIRNSRTN
jgi:hypothetical protein